MNESEPNFEPLRRLLTLKRHETPPPGYFNNFSRSVIARIRANEAETLAGRSDQPFSGIPWFFRLLQSLESKPMFAGSFATALCGLLLFAAVMGQRPEMVAQTLLQPVPQEAAPLMASATSTTLSTPGTPVNQFLIADNSTNPVMNFAASPIGQMSISPQFTAFPASGN